MPAVPSIALVSILLLREECVRHTTCDEEDFALERWNLFRRREISTRVDVFHLKLEKSYVPGRQRDGDALPPAGAIALYIHFIHYPSGIHRFQLSARCLLCLRRDDYTGAYDVANCTRPKPDEALVHLCLTLVGCTFSRLPTLERTKH
jgi:hypothetical protein